MALPEQTKAKPQKRVDEDEEVLSEDVDPDTFLFEDDEEDDDDTDLPPERESDDEDSFDDDNDW